jgi:signal transduction histidine kinase
MWVVAAYAIGLALRRIVDVWLKDRVELEQQNTESFFNFLHSHIKAGLAAVEHEVPDVESMVEKLHDLQTAVGKERLRLLLSGGQIPLATVFSQHVQVFNDAIDIKETPRVGGRTVSQPVGRILDRALGDLLTNAVRYGAETARIRFSPTEGGLALEILDDGPGFDDRVLDTQGKSLHDLRQSARKLGGDLTRRSCEPSGSHLILTLPEA